jgi:hypothetical protein
MQSPRSFLISVILIPHLFARHYDHHHQIDKDARYAARDQCDQESQAKPKGTDAEELGQSAAYAGYYAIPA